MWLKKFKLPQQWFNRVCVMQWKKNTICEALGLQMLYIRFMWMTPAQRAPYGWCMGAIFVQKRWSRASLFFRGNSSCLAALIQAGWLYLHRYSNKEACTNSRRGSRFFFFSTELMLQNWNKLMQPVTVGVCIWADARHALQIISRAATNYFFYFR